MKRCKRCLMPDTRPGMTFDSEGICAACRVYEHRPSVDYHAREGELRKLCDKHRSSHGEYDCIIAVSGGKDSHFQTHVMSHLMGMNPLLVTVGDNFPMTKAGIHNLENIRNFDVGMVEFRPSKRAQRLAQRFCFEKYGKPTYFTDRYIYTFPLWVAARLGIPLVVYGENVQYEYSGVGPETPSAAEQIHNSVADDIPSEEIYRECGKVLPYFDPPAEYGGLSPIYLSYFYPWDSHKNYLVAQTYGFHSLAGEWDRTHCIDNYCQVDSRGYLVGGWMKYPKFGHAAATDIASRLVRYGLISRDEGMRLVRERDGNLDPLAIADFCDYCGYALDEFKAIVDRWYNPKLFERIDGKWKLKEDE